LIPKFAKSNPQTLANFGIGTLVARAGGGSRGRQAMKTLCVLQHVEAEYLGLLEDHFEARNIRFRYCRPFAPGVQIPATAEEFDGLVLLGAGPKGIVSGNLIPTLGPELRLTKDFLDRGLPVVGIGIGACILASAAGGGAAERPLRMTLLSARRVACGALGGHLPPTFPAAVYMRDRPVLPRGAEVLAADDAGDPLVFQIGGNCFGLVGHPGIKSAMIEDLIMEFDEVPEGTAETLPLVRAAQPAIAAALSQIMIGLVEATRLME
jgi:GMP synthase-like glutamine amidotransferase